MTHRTLFTFVGIVVVTAVVANGCTAADPRTYGPRIGRFVAHEVVATTRGDSTIVSASVTGSGPSSSSCSGSFRDALPQAPAVIVPPDVQAPGDGLAHASCDDGDDLLASDPSTSEVKEGHAAHATGQLYFEATVASSQDTGWSTIGVFAPPDSAYDGMEAEADSFQPNVSAAGVTPSGPGVYGVAADLDGGQVFFYKDGNKVSESAISLLPGVGAYAPSLVSMLGNAITLNLGARPFRFAIPAGYAAWATPGVDGTCAGDTVPNVSAPITSGSCNDEGPALTTFQSACDSNVVAIGVYETLPGSPGEREVGEAHVHITRAGHITLGLSSYDPTHWIIDADDGAIVDRVFAYGFYPQTVTAPDSTAVTTSFMTSDGSEQDGTGSVVCGFEWPFDDGGCDTQGFVQALEHDAGAPLAQYAGCYGATEFVVQ